MSIKLFSLAKELNVGVGSLAGFLRKKGFDVEDNNPNVRIENEEFDLLLTEFGKSLSKGETERIRKKFVKQKQGAPASAPSAKEETAGTAAKEAQVIATEVPQDMRPRFTIKGKVETEKPAAPAPSPKDKEPDIVREDKPTKETAPVKEETKVVPVKEDKPKEEKPKQEEPKREEPKREEPVQVVPVTKPVEKPAEKLQQPVVTQKPQEAETPPAQEMEKKEDTEEVFRLKTNTQEPQVKVVGKIDLSSINSSTRPKKKTKEDRQREQNDADGKKKRKRINKAAVDVKKEAAKVSGEQGKRNAGGGSHPSGNKNNRPTQQQSNASGGRKNNKRQSIPPKVEISDEDVQRQVKETLARLTTKKTSTTLGRGAKYRKDKRDAASRAAQDAMELNSEEQHTLKLTEFVTVSDLSNMMDVPVNEVIATCMSIGMMVGINQRLDAETINIVAEEFGFKTEFVSADLVEAIAPEEDNEEDLVARPPIVTVMGHVDHGKTSLLDRIRNTNVIEGEAGGITQHIGAYGLKLPSGRRITFLDTPGHEAFTAMRARGAKITDIAIIIVAADDDVMPQTVEAINHASAAGVPMVFAINKIDKPAANPERIKEQLANMNYLVEDWGGKYQSQEISAKKGLNITELLEKVLLEADILELKANPNRRAIGSIIESSLDKGRGYVSTVMVQNGTLNMGDVVLAGTCHGRIKAMFNERNQRVKQAGPSEPVLILGLNGAPAAGDTFNVLETEQEAREIANRREQLQREQGLRTHKILTLEDISRRRAIGNFQELNLIVKGDVDGSVEALSDSLIRLSTEEIQVNVIHKAVGQISESDVVLAAASSAIIIGFQVRPSVAARKQADSDGVEIRTYSIIYDTIEDIKSAMEGMLSPEIREEVTGSLEVLQTFKISKVGTIAGCMVKEGKVKRTSKVRLIRDGIVIHTGELGSLKRFKDDAKEVVAGLECGLNLAHSNDIQDGDIIEAFDEIEIKKTL
ncbi:translation initiation factor IF-2 [Porphyromonas gulae]|uniref:Translation initiation factor IF-2 n=1 Tax=Porphyromonas gulae TaxID=111105 RepID=A0A0A2FTG3_9PORP|nr:translation initiation factor IF-2 [Porphyromonas gulae]KGN94298.1 translation initiation factor IF-2 [Porphyromonas gulae]